VLILKQVMPKDWETLSYTFASRRLLVKGSFILT